MSRIFLLSLVAFGCLIRSPELLGQESAPDSIVPLIREVDELKVDTAKTDMSFSVKAALPQSGRHLEWNGANLNTVFAQRGNLLNWRFLKMLREVLRFDSAEGMYQALAEGRVELVLDDAVSGYFGFLDTAQGQGFEQVGNKVVAPKHFGKGQGIAVRKGDHVLRERLDRALSIILSNGVYKRIEKQYFKQFTVY